MIGNNFNLPHYYFGAKKLYEMSITITDKKTLSPENHLHATESKWFAVRTGFRKEKIVHKRLKSKGIISYLPLYKVIRRYERKVKHLELPLINSYLFVKITKKDYVRVLETEHVHAFIHFNRNLIAIPGTEIDTVRRVLGEDTEIAVVEEGYTRGDQVEVIGGRLTGLHGELIEGEGQKRLIIRLEKIGVGLEVEVDAKYLRKQKK